MDDHAGDGAPSTKRLVNDLMRETLRHQDDHEQIAFFCECVDDGCHQVVWLSKAEFDGARKDPDWSAVIDEHASGAARKSGASPR